MAANEMLSHIAVALAVHARAMARNGMPLPDGFVELVDLVEGAASYASPRQVAPSLAGAVLGIDGAVMERSELLSKAGAGQILNVSPRTVDRLIASGDLIAVRIAGSVRIRRADLDAYVAALTPRSFRDSLQAKDTG